MHWTRRMNDFSYIGCRILVCELVYVSAKCIIRFAWKESSKITWIFWLLGDRRVHNKLSPCEWTGLMSHFEMFAIHFPLRFSRDRYFLSFVECLGLFATIPFLTWSHDSWMRNSVRLRPEHWATHTSNESHALRNPFSPKTRVIALHANPQDFMRLYKNPTSASEHPARKNNLRPRELNVPLDKARLFYSYLRQSFSLQSFYLQMSTNATQNKKVHKN